MPLSQHDPFNPPRPPGLVIALNHHATKPHIARSRLKARRHPAQKAIDDARAAHRLYLPSGGAVGAGT